jgi:hypothetical protein
MGVVGRTIVAMGQSCITILDFALAGRPAGSNLH